LVPANEVTNNIATKIPVNITRIGSILNYSPKLETFIN